MTSEDDQGEPNSLVDTHCSSTRLGNATPIAQSHSDVITVAHTLKAFGHYNKAKFNFFVSFPSLDVKRPHQ